MAGDPRRLKGGEFFLDIAKYVLTAIAVSSLITERINIRIGLLGLGVGAVLAFIGVLILPPKKRESEKEGAG